MDDIKIEITISREYFEKLERLADERGITISNLIEQMADEVGA